MPQSFTKLYTHIIFATKYRTPYLKERGLCNEMYAYIGGILLNLDCHPIVINGFTDHIHILCSISKSLPLSKIVGEVKRASSIWAKTKDCTPEEFHWQNGYAAFSIGRSEVDRVRKYIENQEKHHCKKTFTKEYRNILIKNQIQYHERYFWD